MPYTRRYRESSPASPPFAGKALPVQVRWCAYHTHPPAPAAGSNGLGTPATLRTESCCRDLNLRATPNACLSNNSYHRESCRVGYKMQWSVAWREPMRCWRHRAYGYTLSLRRPLPSEYIQGCKYGKQGTCWSGGHLCDLSWCACLALSSSWSAQESRSQYHERAIDDTMNNRDIPPRNRRQCGNPDSAAFQCEQGISEYFSRPARPELRQKSGRLPCCSSKACNLWYGHPFLHRLYLSWWLLLLYVVIPVCFLFAL